MTSIGEPEGAALGQHDEDGCRSQLFLSCLRGCKGSVGILFEQAEKMPIGKIMHWRSTVAIEQVQSDGSAPDHLTPEVELALLYLSGGTLLAKSYQC